MKKFFILSIIVVTAIIGLNSCASGRISTVRDVKPQSSVKMTLTNDSVKKGVIFKGDKEQLVFVNAATHKTDTVMYNAIKSMEYLNRYLDFNGYEMPKAEIKTYKGLKKTLLYGGGGLILGAAAGTGAAIALFAPKKDGDSGNSNAAIATIAALGTAGAVVFGWLGSKVDFEDAVFKTRKARYMVEKKAMDKKRKELERLKKSKK